MAGEGNARAEAKVHTTRKKQMVLAFFEAKGLIYTNFMPRGKTVNAMFIIEALTRFLRIFKQKKPEMAARDLWFHWYNALLHTAAMITDWMGARQFQVIQRPPFLPDLAPADFFFPQELVSLNLTQGTFKKVWKGAVRTLLAAVFATAFRWCYECCEIY